MSTGETLPQPRPKSRKKWALPVAAVLALALIGFAVFMGLRESATTREGCKAEVSRVLDQTMKEEKEPDQEAVKVSVQNACRSQSQAEVEAILGEVMREKLGGIFESAAPTPTPSPTPSESPVSTDEEFLEWCTDYVEDADASTDLVSAFIDKPDTSKWIPRVGEFRKSEQALTENKRTAPVFLRAAVQNMIDLPAQIADSLETQTETSINADAYKSGANTILDECTKAIDDYTVVAPKRRPPNPSRNLNRNPSRRRP